MTITERAAARIRRIMERFPCEEAVITRPNRDSYGQEADGDSPVGTINVWRESLVRPDKWTAKDAGQIYEDAGMEWICALSPAPEVRHGDRITIGQEVYTVRNVLHDSVSVRHYWQVEQR